MTIFHMTGFSRCKRCSQQGFQFSKPEPRNKREPRPAERLLPGQGPAPTRLLGGTAGARRLHRAPLGDPQDGERPASEALLPPPSTAWPWLRAGEQRSPFTALPAAAGPRRSLAGPQGCPRRLLRSPPRANEGSSLRQRSWERARGQAMGQGLSPQRG